MFQSSNSLDTQGQLSFLRNQSSRQYSNAMLYFRTFIIIQGTFLLGATLGNYNQVQDTMNLVVNNNSSVIAGVCNAIVMIGAGIGSISATFLLNSLKKRTHVMIFADIVAIIGIGLQQYPQPLYTLYAGRFLVGVAYSLNVIIAQIYLKEFLPDENFGNHLNLIGFSIQIGILLSFLISLGLSSNPADNTAYYWRIVLGFPMLFPLIRQIFLNSMFREETPVYYLKEDNQERLQTALQLIYPPDLIKDQIKRLSKNYQNEDNTNKKSQTLISIFSPEFRMRLFLAQIILLMQPLSGITVFTAFTTQIYQLSVSFNVANTLSVVQMFWAISGLLIAQKLLGVYGRKTIFMGTLFLNAFQSIILVISALAIQQNWVEGTLLSVFKYALIGSLFLYNLCIGLSISSVCYILVAELVPKAGLSIVNVVQYSINAGVTFMFPIFTAKFDQGYFFMILCACNILVLPVLGFLLKETRGKTELDISMDYLPSHLKKNKALINVDKYNNKV